MKKIGWCLAAAAIALGVRGEGDVGAQVPALVARAAENYRVLVQAMSAEKPNTLPRCFEAGKMKVIEPPDWCSGFFPGGMWYLFEATGDAFWREQAKAYTERLIEPLRHDAHQHDVGFRTYCSAGNALRLTGDARYAAFLHDTSAALRTRYDEGLGLIRSWNSAPSKNRFMPQFLVIIDNMMNLELLEWDAKNGGAAKSDAIARSHANMTDRHHFRADGSAYHVLDYDPYTKRVHATFAGQGISSEGTWARGQAWAIYGFTMMYRETKDARYLRRARASAKYWLEEPNRPADGVPYWDFKAPNIPHEERDASAAAITASALIELSGFVEPAAGAAYLVEAKKILATLSSAAYFAQPNECGGFLIKHSVGGKPTKIATGRGGEVDACIIYGDYYYLEALLRLRKTLRN